MSRPVTGIRKQNGQTQYKCGVCGEWKEPERFYEDKGSSRGRQGYCKTCQNRVNRLTLDGTNHLSFYFIMQDIREQTGQDNICLMDLTLSQKTEVVRRVIEFEKEHPLPNCAESIGAEEEKYQELYGLEI